MKTFKLTLEKMGGTNPEEYIGKIGDVWIDGDPDNGFVFRMSDGQTAGGITYDIVELFDRMTQIENNNQTASYDLTFLQENSNVADLPDSGRYCVFTDSYVTINIPTFLYVGVNGGYKIDIFIPNNTSTLMISSHVSNNLRWLDKNITDTSFAITGPANITLQRLYNEFWQITGIGTLVP